MAWDEMARRGRPHCSKPEFCKIQFVPEAETGVITRLAWVNTPWDEPDGQVYGRRVWRRGHWRTEGARRIHHALVRSCGTRHKEKQQMQFRLVVPSRSKRKCHYTINIKHPYLSCFAFSLCKQIRPKLLKPILLTLDLIMHPHLLPAKLLQYPARLMSHHLDPRLDRGRPRLLCNLAREQRRHVAIAGCQFAREEEVGLLCDFGRH